MTNKKIGVLFIAAEAEPFIKIGGLADVAGSLPKAIANLSITKNKIDIRLCLPYYPKVREKFQSLPPIATFLVCHKTGNLPAFVYRHEHNGIPVYFIDGDPISRDLEVYNLDTSFVGDKFVFFNKAVIAFLENDIFKPDIIHLNDWHTALIPHLIREGITYSKNIRTLLTLHNLPFMGAGIQASLENYSIPSSKDVDLPHWALNLPLPMGLSTVDRIVPVSPNYAREIIETDAGCGLNTFLRTRRSIIKGILNGLDTDLWDPHTDDCIKSTYSLSTLLSRSINKKELLREFNLSGSNKPLLAIISRMDQQKGIDIAINSLRLIGNKAWHLIILGSGNPDLEKMSQELMSEFPRRVRTINTFNPTLSHRLYASADILLMPSRYEPCGLSQLIAMRYGCIPVATDVGGLHDTITDICQNKFGTGFLCDSPTPDRFAKTILDALSLFNNKTLWLQLMQNAMNQDFSWKKSAEDYYDIYTQLVERGSNELL